MALPRIINSYPLQPRAYGDMKRGETFTLSSIQEVANVWQRTGWQTIDGTMLATKPATGEAAGLKPDTPVYPFSIDISATPAD